MCHLESNCVSVEMMNRAPSGGVAIREANSYGNSAKWFQCVSVRAAQSETMTNPDTSRFTWERSGMETPPHRIDRLLDCSTSHTLIGAAAFPPGGVFLRLMAFNNG